MSIDKKLWLIGAGYMGVEYAKVLKVLEQDFICIGRGEEKLAKIREEFDLAVYSGGLENYISTSSSYPEKAIVAVNTSFHLEICMSLIKAGCKSILLEKPGGLNYIQIEKLKNLASEYSVDVSIAYNRRFYESVIKAKELIEKDGGATSFNFEFTEWSHQIEPLVKEPGEKDFWFLANSTHVVDLAFFLGGFPKEMSSFRKGELSWHPSGSIFSGAGVSENGALFSYKANWESAGRWGVEVLTKENKYILMPLEKLQIQKRGSISTEYVEVNYLYDEKYKPGLYKQTEAFVESRTSELLSISKQFENLEFYKKICME